jgi:cell wall assembly regulator SMI1
MVNTTMNEMETPEMAISWQPYVWPQALPLTLAKLRAAEQRLGVRFPQDFVDCVLQHQGETPEPCTFDYGDGYSSVLNELYHFEDSPSASSQAAAQKSLEIGGVPAGVVAIAGDPAGNHLCLDFRADPQAPIVVMLDYEAGGDNPLVPVAKTFTELLAQLH